MRASKFYISTTKEAPNEAELISHKLMLRAGLIRRLTSGVYTWLPLGLRVLRKIEAIVRSEMNAIGALEMLMPVVQNAELWQESGRWEFYGRELFRLKDRHERDFCLGPTHEEVVVDTFKHVINSYKQLPLTIYQIQTKFRDEIRPRFGVMRAREFIMKDAYSFHSDYDSLTKTYNDMYQAYSKIFTRLGLKYRAVAADTGSIGGTGSHEFQVLADSGEDIIAYSDTSDYAANLELATSIAPQATSPQELKTMEQFATPNQKTCEEVAKLLNIPLEHTVKSLVFVGIDDKPVLVLIRGDHTLNEIKIGKIAEIKQPLTFVPANNLQEYFNCNAGFIGPVGFNGIVIADRDVAVMRNFVCGANRDEHHLKNVNFERDCKIPNIIADIRNVVVGDTTPDGKGSLKLCRGIEVGHIFQLRQKYSSSMDFTCLDAQGNTQIVEMGCYGIGVSRIMAAAIEQHNDARGIIFPCAMAPFEVIITPINYNTAQNTRDAAEKLYNELKTLCIDVLLDDRNERAGSMLADSELLGIPYRIVVSEKTLSSNQVEFYTRSTGKTILIAQDQIVTLINEVLNNAKSEAST